MATAWNQNNNDKQQQNDRKWDGRAASQFGSGGGSSSGGHFDERGMWRPTALIGQLTEQDDDGIEMEECGSTVTGGNDTATPSSTGEPSSTITTSTTAVTAIENEEDPESRDSGVSLGGQSVVSSCSSSSNSGATLLQGTLANAIDNVLEISGRRDHHQHQLPPPQYQQHYHTPLKQRSLSDINNYDDFIREETAHEEIFQRFCGQSPLKKKQRRSNGPTDFSFMHQQQQNQSTSSALSATLTELPDLDIPASARPIHRVHSASVFERSFGSPEMLERYSLRTVDRPAKDSRAFRSIDAETLVVLLESMTEEQFMKRFILVDCRYPYEFNGGHILYSKNIFEIEDIIGLFFPEDGAQFAEISQLIPIFYCEFSQKRGPRMANALREHDRNVNEHRYPYVDYKEIYLLDRGYRHFFEERKLTKFCEPQAYIYMWDPTYADERKKYDGHRRNTTKKRRRRF